MKENKPNLLTAALEAAASAQKLGIPVIDEEQFAALLDTGELP